MRCHHCNSVMQETDSVAEGRVSQTWYHCPVCACTHTVTQPCESRLRRLGDLQRCSSGWPEAAAAWQMGVR